MSALWDLSVREAGETSDTVVTLNRIGGTYPDATPGRELDLDVGFEGAVANESAGFRTRYETVRQLLDYTGLAAYGTDSLGVPWYTETLPTAATVDSHVVSLTPSSDLQNVSVRGMWALVTGGGDETTMGADLALSLSIFVLADIDDYADRDAVEAALGESFV